MVETNLFKIISCTKCIVLNFYFYMFLLAIQKYNFLNQFIFIGDILEVGVQCSIAMRDIPAFERYMAQLKCYYLDYKYTIYFINN